MSITVKIKPVAGGESATFAVETTKEATIGELKEAVSQRLQDTAAQDIKLIYKGQILKDAQTVGSYGEEQPLPLQ